MSSNPEQNKSYRSGPNSWRSISGDILERQVFYHGYISREHLRELLQDKGDFLVRRTEVEAKSGKWEVVISINTGAEGPDKIRHFVLRLDPTDKLYHVRNDPAFQDPLKLIQEYYRNEWPLDKSDPNTVLRRAIVTQGWELKHHMLILEEKLGAGSYGDVFKGVLKRGKLSPINVAIKSLKNASDDKEKISELMSEARTVRQLDHPNIVRVHGVSVDKLPIYIVMELCQGGSLDVVLKKMPALPLKEKLQICLDVARGLEYLHSRRIIHRDVAARNCLYDPDLKRTKLSDFGLAKAASKLMPNQKEKLPIKWLAPEVLTNIAFSTKSDVFAFGVLVWEIFADGASPYPGMQLDDIKRNVISGKRLQMPPGTPPWLRALIVNHVWQQDPANRCDMSKVVRLMKRYMRDPRDGNAGGHSSRHGSSRKSGRSSHHGSSRKSGRSSHHGSSRQSGRSSHHGSSRKSGRSSPHGSSSRRSHRKRHGKR